VPRRDVDIGKGLMLNWWVHLACLAWAMDEVDEFWDAIERAFVDIEKSS